MQLFHIVNDIKYDTMIFIRQLLILKVYTNDKL